MPGFKEYHEYDALGLAKLIRDKLITPRDAIDEAISRAKKMNPQLNAIINPLYDYAQSASTNLPHGVFSGVPFLLKDLLADIKGIPTSRGSAVYKNIPMSQDSTLVHRFKNTGVNIFGKTNTPELGLMGVTEPEAFGPTRNPWDVSRTPGGSSGGSAAAVAARIAPIASAGDGGGSIRIPAAHCGLFGLKPTRGRNPSGPAYGEHWDGATCEHVVTRTVRDSAAMLDATQGKELGSHSNLQSPVQSYLDALLSPPKALRIAYSITPPYGGNVDPEYRIAIEKSAALLTSLGHHVEEASPMIDGNLLLNCYLTMYFGHTAADVATVKHQAGSTSAKKFENNTRFLALIGECLSAGDFVNAKREWFKLSQSMDIFHRQFDLLMTPTVATLPVAIGELKLTPAKRLQTKMAILFGPSSMRFVKKRLIKLTKEEARKNLTKTPFTQLANLTGQPAMSVPLHMTSKGLPCGVQFIAPFGDELTLFKLAGQLEKVHPWINNMPEFSKNIIL